MSTLKNATTKVIFKGGDFERWLDNEGGVTTCSEICTLIMRSW